jgi:hypothetical protein
MRWVGHVAGMGKRGASRVLVGKTEGKRPLRRPSFIWEDNINFVCQNLKCECVDWSDVAQHSAKALVSTVMDI